jgi:hypothetical protein
MTRKYSKQKETDICGKSLEDRQAMYGLRGDDVRRLSWPKVLREMQKGAVPEKRRTEAEETYTSGYHARS